MKIKTAGLKLQKSEQLCQTYECSSTCNEQKNEQGISFLHKETSEEKISTVNNLERNEESCICNNVCNQNGIDSSVDNCGQTELYSEKTEDVR